MGTPCTSDIVVSFWLKNFVLNMFLTPGPFSFTKVSESNFSGSKSFLKLAYCGYIYTILCRTKFKLCRPTLFVLQYWCPCQGTQNYIHLQKVSIMNYEPVCYDCWETSLKSCVKTSLLFFTWDIQYLFLCLIDFPKGFLVVWLSHPS